MNDPSGKSSQGLPEGTVTFLFTDIEGSTKLLRQLGDEYAAVLADQRHILRTIFAKWHGREVDTQGDSFFISFARATEAVAAAAESQRAMAKHTWPQDVIIWVRMGLHTGEPLTAEEGYVGMDVHRAARIAHIGHGGQVLLSETTAPLVMDDLPQGVSLLDLGRHRLKDIDRPERIRQLVIQDLPSEFPPLKSLEVLGPEASPDEKIRLPAFLEEDAAIVPSPVFVGREGELDRLSRILDGILKGHGGVFFFVGDVGSGKTALLDAFARQAQDRVSDLLVARGTCSAFTGSGDPYAPFRTLLRQLTGDVESAWKSGLISREGACRLWSEIPPAVKALVKYGPNLIDTLIPGSALLDRVSAAVPADGTLLGHVKELIEKDKAAPGSLEQQGLFEEVRDVLVELSARTPILLLLDDMQWADSGSINLFFHLGRELAGARVLLICAYRPEEVALGRDGEKHPLEPVLSELKRAYGEIWIDLNQVQGEHFVDDFIDSEPNHLGDSFRNRLFEHTSGHALFTVELLRDLQERGDLVKDDERCWVEGPELDWNRLPTRVEGVIEARIGRLAEELRDVLTVAAVEGEDFTVQVVAQIQEIQERKLLHILSRELEKHHKLVRARETFRLNGILLSRYRFAHTLFQRYLYNDLSPGERTLLHGEIAAVLEELYGGDLDAVIVQLGMHYAAANMGDKAVPFLLKAGDQARAQYAFHEAAKHYETALTFLKSANLERKVAQTLMKLGLTYHMAMAFKRSRRAYDEGFELWRTLATEDLEQSLSPAPHPYRLVGPGYKTSSVRDPAMTRTESSLLDNIFSGLVEHTSEWNVVPDIAHSWTVSENGTKYVFHLRHDVFWSDGTPLTAHDFEYALKRALDPATQSPFADILFDVTGAEAYNKGDMKDPAHVGVKAAADHSLEINLKYPVGYFIHILAQNIAKPIPRHKVETLGSDWSEPANLVSNGPFLLEDIPDESKVILRRNPRYHGLFRGNIERIILYTPVGEWVYYPRYEEETLDVIKFGEIPLSERRMVKQRHIEDYHSVPSLFVGSMDLSPLLPPFDRLEIRQAFAHAFNKEAFSSKIGPSFFPAAGGFIPPGVPGHSPDIGLVYDPARARRLLEAAGFPRGRGIPPIPITVRSRIFVEIMEIVAANWRDVLDIDCYVHYDESVDTCSEIPEACAIPRAWVADYPDPDNFLRTALYPIMKLWKNEEYIRLVEQARKITDQNKRVQLYRKADRILIHDAVVIPVIYERQERLVKPWVRNKVFEPWKDVIIDPH